MKMGIIAEREAVGRAAREHAKRSVHRHIGPLERDPLELLRASSEGRVRKLVPLRYGRMLASPLAFFRGSALMQAHDLSLVPNTGMAMPICGDAHLLNFGAFATPERQLVFDLNDFDEVSPGPWEWDLKRLVASFVVAARHMRYSRGVAETLVMSAVNEYRDRMRQYAEYGALELWYEKITFDRMIETALTPEARRLIRRGMEKAAGRTDESMLDRLTQRSGDHWTLRDAPPSLFHVNGVSALFDAEDDWFGPGNGRRQVGKLYDGYLKTLLHDRRELLGHFVVQDFVFKVVGVGSVGTRCFVLLAVDRREHPLFLQIKEARRSVIAQYFRSPAPKHEGERVVEGQRLLQAANDTFLGWSTGPAGRHFYFRHLRDMKLSADIELLDSALLTDYARLCGWSLARAHARAGNAAVEIAAYIGRSDQFADALTGYAFAYADQVERDYDAFLKAVRSGALEARTDDDMAADFRI
ncbi:uncharacterized protein (DUF2252 family) [Paraburkholderia caballeronis]|uniref:DUF2252 domain-containing protein n=1 Tax=Paraburkholderia caballeronis TaxID=416943 RepID=UPI0010658D88|nr:DUF2252 domain-containing protein [Paraburkholderia caballeronis]TDV34455.1 uncharacterized protein (DUF2252 family) [Paraburkholderia caballeronis]